MNDNELLSIEEMLSLSEDELNELLQEYNKFKADRENIQKEALLQLPENPTLVLDCIHYLRVNGGLSQEGIFRVNGDGEIVNSIKSAFTTNTDLSDVLLSLQQRGQLKLFDVASAIKSYFRLLKDPLVPLESYEKMKDIVDTERPVEQIVKELKSEITNIPEPNKSILSFIMILFQDIVDNSKVNKMGPKSIATCLTMSVLRFETTSDNPVAAVMEVSLSTRILELMIQYIDFTDYIRHQRYFQLLKNTSYKPELLPKDVDDFLDHPQFARFQRKMAAFMNVTGRGGRTRQQV